MAKGTVFGSERRILKDAETGVEIIRLSGFPTINNHVYTHSRCFTYDSSDVVFYSYRHLARDSPRDIFAVSTDGMDLRQITDRKGVGWMTCSPVDRSAFYPIKNAIWKVDIDSYEQAEVAKSPLEIPLGILSIGGTGKRLLSSAIHEGEGFLIAADLVRGSTDVIYSHPSSIGHLQLEPVSSRYAIFHDTHPSLGKPRIWCINSDGSDPRILYDDDSHGNLSHFVWLPGQDALISTLQHPQRGIVKIALDGEVTLISDAENFWHVGASLDGRTICSDTLALDTGIHLIDADTGNHEKLCLSKSSNAHPQWTHPHPTWSPDGNMILFTSDLSGAPQVYLVKVPGVLQR